MSDIVYQLMYQHEEDVKPHPDSDPDADHEPICCEACQQQVPVARFRRGVPSDGHKYLCELCASTMVGGTIEYRSGVDDKLVMQTVAAVGNLVLQRLEARLAAVERLVPLAERLLKQAERISRQLETINNNVAGL